MAEQPLRVLLVEDDPMLLNALQNALADLYGWTVYAAADPEEARPHYPNVDVVMSDWSMPNGGGARVLKESPAPVLIYSSDASALEYPNRLSKPASLPTIQNALLQVAKLT
jgi:DNA-binding NarL/FixJ family response regulator